MSVTRRGKQRKKVMSGAEKWKNKIWLETKSPTYLNNIVIGHSPTSSVENAIGRTIKLAVNDLTQNFKDMHKLVTFKIDKINGTSATTQLFRYELSQDYMRSMIRNHRSRIDGLFNIKLTDESRLRINVFCVTSSRVKGSIKKEIRLIMKNILDEIIKESNFQHFSTILIEGEINQKIKEAIEAKHSIKVLEVSKVKILSIGK